MVCGLVDDIFAPLESNLNEEWEENPSSHTLWRYRAYYAAAFLNMSDDATKNVIERVLNRPSH